MKKVVSVIISVFLITILVSPVFANTEVLEEKDVLETENGSEFSEIKNKTEANLAKYEKKYGKKTYAVTAMILDGVRIYSIPFCFVGIAVGSIYQYMIGIRKLDVRDKGFALIITFVTILLICQVLPLIFTIVVNGWRG